MMNTTVARYIADAVVTSYLVILLFIIYKVAIRLKGDWMPGMLITISLLPLWLLVGMPGAVAMTGYPFLIIWFLTTLSFVLVPFFILVEIGVLISRGGVIHNYPLHLLAIVFSSATVGAILLLHYNQG